MSFVFYCLIFILLASLMPDAQGKDFLYSLFENILAFLSLFLPICSIFVATAHARVATMLSL